MQPPASANNQIQAPRRTCLQPSSTVSQLPTISMASWLSMNSHTPSLARTMNLSWGVSSITVQSGSDVTPTLQTGGTRWHQDCRSVLEIQASGAAADQRVDPCPRVGTGRETFSNGGQVLQTLWGKMAKLKMLPCMLHSTHDKVLALVVSAWHAHWWARTSPSARLMASPGIQAYCSHTRKGPMGCPSSSTSLHQIQPRLHMCGMPIECISRVAMPSSSALLL